MNFKPLEEYLDSINYRENVVGGTVPGSNTVIYMNHNKIFSYSTGYEDIEKKTRVSPNRLYNIYSCSKIVTAVAAVQLIERGIIRVTDPLSKYIPAFADIKVRETDEKGNTVALREPKSPILLRHLLTMTSGMGYDMHSEAIERVIKETDGRAPTLQVCNAMAKDPLFFDPGEHYRYSESLDVMGGVIEAVTGMRFSEYVEKNIFSPLGMNETTYHPEHQLDKMATQYKLDLNTRKIEKTAPNLHRLGTEYDGGGAGIASTANDFVLLLDALANGGVGKTGARILTELGIDLMRTPALTPELQKEYAVGYNSGYGYAYGVRTCIDRSISGNLASLGEFGWDGWKMCVAMVDPALGLSVFHTEHLEGFQPEIIPNLRNVVYHCIGQ